MKNREVSFGGLVTGVREGTTKKGSPFMIIHLEDFTGSGDIPLFSDDCVNFGKYGRLGLYLYVKGRIQPRKYPKPQAQYELKINSMQLLPEVKDKLIEKFTITLPLKDMNTQMVEELSALAKNNPGNSLLYFRIVDGEHNTNVDLFARSIKIAIRQELINFLTENDNLLFKVN
jgi:DNA polymerase-3 subunit alpha